MCLSTTYMWKIKQTWKLLKKSFFLSISLALLPQTRRSCTSASGPAVPGAFGFNQVQSRNSTSCCFTLIRRSQILQIGRFLLLVILFDESFAFKYLKGTISEAAAQLVAIFRSIYNQPLQGAKY